MIKDNNILITIGIPVYNGEKSIADLIRSIIIPEDLLDNIEILVSDNCSTDNTAEIVKEFTHVKYFKNLKNIGYDRNVHNVFEKALGEYVWTIGADDVIIGDKTLNRICKIIVEQPNVRLINVAENSGLKNEYEIYSNDENFLIDSKFQSGFVSSNIINRETWLNANPSDYFDTGWIHFGVIMKIANCNTSIITRSKLVGENPRFSQEPKNWDLNGSSLLIMLKLVQIFCKMPQLGYSKNATKKAKLLIKNQYPRNIIKAKAKGLNVSFQMILDFISSYSAFPTFWLLDLPFLVAPKFICRSVYSLRNIFKTQ